MQLRTLIMAIMFFSTMLPLVVLHMINIDNERALLLSETQFKLEEIADIHHQRIKTLLANKKQAVALIKSRTQLRTIIEESASDLSKQQAEKLRKNITDVIEATDNIEGIALYSRQQNLLFYSNNWLNIPILNRGESYEKNAFNVEVIFIEDQQQLLFIEPITFNNEVIGFIKVAFKSDELNRIVSDFTGLGQSGEIVLAAKDKNGDAIFLTPTRHDPSVALTLTVSKNNLEIPITHAMNGVNDVFPDYVDYRDTPVLAISHHIPETNWGMIVKIDKQEMFKKLEVLTLRSFKVLLVALLVVTFTSILIAAWFTKPFINIYLALAKSAKGKIDFIEEHSAIREIKEVSKAINSMNKQRLESDNFLHQSIEELTELNAKLDSEAERFKRWKESNFIGIIHSDAQGHILEANSTILDMIGYSREELENGEIDWKNLTPPEYLHLDIKAVEEANIKGYWTPFEKVYIHKDGHPVPILIGGSIFNKDSQEFIVFVVNLSEKYHQMKELKRYKGIIENSRDMFAFLDLDYRYKTVNQAYLDIHGLTREEVIGKSVSEILGETLFFNKLKEKIDKALQGESVSFIETNLPNTTKIKALKVSYVPYWSDDGVIVGFIFKGEDITELEAKQRIIELKEAEQKHIIESMLEGVFTVDSEGKILSFNPEAENIFGYKESEVVGKSVDMLTEGVGHHKEKVQNFIKTGFSQIINNRLGRDIRAKHRQGHTFPIRIAVASMPPTEQGELHFIANFQDMSEQEQQRKLLNRSLKLESLGNIAGGVAHDFNNILGIILGYTELLNEFKQDPSSCIEAIENACSRGQKLTNNLLTFAKKSNLTPIQVNINQLIEKNKKLLETAMTSKIKLHLELDKQIGNAYLEENLFEDLLLNMAINAMHAMPDGGQFLIKTCRHTLSYEESSALELNAEEVIKITLTDTGCGIPPEHIDKVFDPFFTTKKESGNGLGLAQCYGFIKSCGGSIDVVSELGMGTSFLVYIPMCEHLEAERTVVDKKLQSRLPDTLQQILLIDDEESIRFLIRTFLEAEGVKVFDTEDPIEALNILKEQKIDFVISDVVMPNNGGVAFIKQAKLHNPSLNYLFISGYIGTDDPEQIIGDAILYKPFNKEKLLQKILSLLPK